MNFYEKQHIQKLTAQQGIIKFVFDDFIRSASTLLTKWSMVNSSDVWVGNLFIENAIDNLLSDMHDNMLTKITDGMTQSWNRGNDKADDLVTNYIKGMSISDTLRDKMMHRNTEAIRSMINHKNQQGLTISKQVWNITDNTKDNLEYYLQSGLSTGRPATLIGQDIRQMLNNPDKRFRRVKNDKGKLVPSKPMQEYHPGQGVYRSAAKNAQRLAATETNKAFRMADHDRWKNMDFVLGIEVDRSPMHRGPCSICDQMVGKYPKDYIFTGNHPWCICIATPILLGPKEFADYLLDETIPKDKIVKDIPSTAKQWVEDNKGKAKGWSKEPFFVRDNKKYFDEKIKKEDVSPLKVSNNYNNTTNTKNASSISKKQPIKEISVLDGSNNSLTSMVTAMENHIRQNKDFETSIVYDQSGNMIIDKKGEQFAVNFSVSECQKMKDCILTHNHPRGWKSSASSMSRIGNSFSIADISLAVKYDIAEIRAVTPLYTFSMKRPQDGWNISFNDATKMMNKENDALKKEFQQRILNGTLTPDQAGVIHFHTLWKRICKKTGWIYTKAKTS